MRSVKCEKSHLSPHTPHLTLMKRFLYTIWEIAEVFFIALIAVVAIKYFLVQPFIVNGASMEPSFYDGDYLLIDELSYRFKDPQRGDVIVFKTPDKPNTDYFKRIIGLPGEEIEIKSGKVYINKQALPEPYLKSSTVTYTYPGCFIQEGQKITILQDKYFVLGDNREQSIDSREFGLISKENIIGKLTICYWNCSTK